MGKPYEILYIKSFEGCKPGNDSSLNVVFDAFIILFSHLYLWSHRMRLKWGQHILKENKRMGQNCHFVPLVLGTASRFHQCGQKKRFQFLPEVTETLDYNVVKHNKHHSKSQLVTKCLYLSI